MQRSSSGGRRGALSTRDNVQKVIENKIYVGSNATSTLSQKLDDIKKEISRQYQHKFSTEKKASVARER